MNKVLWAEIIFSSLKNLSKLSKVPRSNFFHLHEVFLHRHGIMDLRWLFERPYHYLICKHKCIHKKMSLVCYLLPFLLNARNLTYGTVFLYQWYYLVNYCKKANCCFIFSFEPCKIQKLQVTCCILDSCCYKLTSTVKTWFWPFDVIGYDKNHNRMTHNV